MKKLIFYGMFAMLLAAPGIVPAQEVQKIEQSSEEKLKQIIEAKTFVFVANTVMPQRGMAQQFLNTQYDLRISGDSVIAELPYFGRAWSAPMNMTGGGIRFVSVDNTYTLSPRKKGGWDINIKPDDQTDTRQLNLTVFENGTATLRVTSTFRDPITFNGFVTAKR